jgi:RNA polymerase sigma-54 factor
MALSTRLVMRQGQSLVMTPQLLQAIKLLQLSSFELSAFVEQELERNPLLERAEETSEPFEASDRQTGDDNATGIDFEADGYEPSYDSSRESARDSDEGSAPDWASENLATSASSIETDLGTEISNTFDTDQPVTPAERTASDDPGLSATSWTGTQGSGGGDGESPNLEAYVASQMSLSDYLEQQLAVAVTGAMERMIGHALIDAIDEAGYLREPVEEIAARLGAQTSHVENVLKIIHTFEPTGIGARDLAECLAIQLRDKDRFDPAMRALVENLPLLARRDFAQLRKICGVDDEDLTDMLKEIRQLDPKPGRAFGGSPIQPVVPDVTVRAASDGSWLVELNSEGLPRVLVNQTYAARVSGMKSKAEDKTYIAECLQSANWLTRSLEQRARTILKVASEIVRQQDAFFAKGVEHLRPLNLKMVADVIGMHESTVSRVTSNKYMSTPRGLFEFKYFFTAAIASHSGGEAHSAEAVRHRIKLMIDQEEPNEVLSDDAIVFRLKEHNVEIARRTVAKYRESLRIASSVERRREKIAALRKKS